MRKAMGYHAFQPELEKLSWQTILKTLQKSFQPFQMKPPAFEEVQINPFPGCESGKKLSTNKIKFNRWSDQSISEVDKVKDQAKCDSLGFHLCFLLFPRSLRYPSAPSFWTNFLVFRRKEVYNPRMTDSIQSWLDQAIHKKHFQASSKINKKSNPY